MLRKLFYAVPADWRHLVRRLYYLPKDMLSPLPGLSPPRGLIYTGGTGERFAEEGQALRDFLQEQGGLRQDSQVLDIGSGIGRLAIPLTQTLQAGSYEGFDVVEFGVRWCQQNISVQHRHFNFTYVDLSNDLYKSAGADATTFVFPYSDRSFTLAVATSVFSHMLPAEVQRYLGEVERVLQPGGRFVFTAFVLDEAARVAMRQHDGLDFSHDRGHYALLDARVTAANVAYERTWLEQAIAAAGLGKSRYFRGRWSGLPGDHAVAFQDVYVLTKPAV